MELKFVAVRNGLRKARSLLDFSLSLAVRGLIGMLFTPFMIPVALRSQIGRV